MWSVGELETVLGDDAPAASRGFGATEEGNFVDAHDLQAHGLNVLQDRGPAPGRRGTRAHTRGSGAPAGPACARGSTTSG